MGKGIEAASGHRVLQIEKGQWFGIPRVNNEAVMSSNAKIMSAIDGKRRNITNSTDKNAWVPAFAGTTVHVGGNSH